MGLRIALADLPACLPQLQQAGKEIAAIVGEANVLVFPADVSVLEDVKAFRDRVYETWGEVRFFTSNHLISQANFKSF